SLFRRCLHRSEGPEMSLANYPLFVFSVLFAFVASISLFPTSFNVWRPEWMGLVIFYWVFRAPEHFGVTTAWVLGVLLDALEGQVLGVNALGLVMVAALVQITHHRLRVFAMPQLAMMVFLVLGLNQMVVHF